MATGTLTRSGLQDAVHRALGETRVDAARLIESVLGHISDAVASGEPVKISRFGTFDFRDKKARVGRNPRTGRTHPIPPQRSLRFRPSREFRERVAAPPSVER